MSDNDREQRTARLVATLATVAAVLMLVVIASSAWLRLSQSGLGCSGWPACYGAFANPNDAAQAAPVRETMHTAEMRAAHRVAAGAAGIVIAIAAALWLSSKRRQRGVTGLVVALLAVTAFLALLGRYTGGVNAPAVTLGNMVGGMALLALTWTLRVKLTAPMSSFASRTLRWTAQLMLLIVAAQVVAGGLVSANYATLACGTFPDCNGAWWPTTLAWAAFDPLYPLQAASSDSAQALRQTLHIMHRYGAVLAALGGIWLVIAVWHSSSRLRAYGAGIAGLLLLQIALGVGLILTPPLLALTVAHDVAAALLLAALAAFASRVNAS
jgi:cytochrome c oxidase assembly protein subunit 15